MKIPPLSSQTPVELFTVVSLKGEFTAHESETSKIRENDEESLKTREKKILFTLSSTFYLEVQV